MAILKTRLFKPVASKDYLIRRRLFDQLDQNSTKPFVLVCAPGGYGKSVLISQWLEHQTKRKYAWISLDRSLNSLPNFLEYLIEATENSTGNSLTEVRNLLKNPNFLPQEVLIEQVVNELAKMEEPMILVLDDYHIITNPAIHHLINILFKFPVPGFQLILITRRNPPLRYKQLIPYGSMLEIRMQDLSFNFEEFSALIKLQRIQDDTLLNKEALLEYTEGWILGIKMVLSAPSLSDIKLGKEVPSSFLKRFEFFTDQLREQLNVSQFRGLLLSSHCDRFNKDLLGFLFESDGNVSLTGDQFIGFLKEHNLFLIQQDEGQYWYRYHHFFQDLLQKEFTLLEPTHINDLLLSISRWFEKQDLWEEAIQYAVRARDFDLATEIIERHRFRLLDQDKWWVIQRGLELLPDHIRKTRIELLLAQMWVNEDTFQTQEIGATLETVGKMAREEPSEKYLPEYHFHQGWHDLILLSDSKNALFHLQQCGKLPRKSSLLYVRRELYLALARQMEFGWEQAIEPLNAIEKAHSTQNLVYLRLQLAKVFVLLTAGRFPEASEVSKLFLFLAKENRFESTKAYSWYLRGNSAFQTFEKEEAQQALKEALTFKGVLNYWVYFDAFAGWAILKSLNGEAEKTSHILAEFQAFASKLPRTRFTEYVRSVHNRLLWHRGEAKQTLPWAESNWKVPLPTEILFALDVPELTKIRIVLTCSQMDQLDKGLKYLEEIETSLQRVHNHCHDIDILLGKAIGYYRKSDTKKLQELLCRIPTMANNRNHFRPLVEVNRVMPQLIEKMDLSSLPIAIQRMLRNPIAGQTPKSTASENGHGKNLSFREIEVVRLAAEGFRNKEIGERLNISEVTVKSHLTNIFRKLQVPNRTSMIRKVQSLQLLDS